MLTGRRHVLTSVSLAWLSSLALAALAPVVFSRAFIGGMAGGGLIALLIISWRPRLHSGSLVRPILVLLAWMLVGGWFVALETLH